MLNKKEAQFPRSDHTEKGRVILVIGFYKLFKMVEIVEYSSENLLSIVRENAKEKMRKKTEMKKRRKKRKIPL